VFEQEVEFILRGLEGQLVQQLLGGGGLVEGREGRREGERERESKYSEHPVLPTSFNTTETSLSLFLSLSLMFQYSIE